MLVAAYKLMRKCKYSILLLESQLSVCLLLLWHVEFLFFSPFWSSTLLLILLCSPSFLSLFLCWMGLYLPLCLLCSRPASPLLSVISERYDRALHAQWECSSTHSIKKRAGMGLKGAPWQWWSRLPHEGGPHASRVRRGEVESFWLSFTFSCLISNTNIKACLFFFFCFSSLNLNINYSFRFWGWNYSPQWRLLFFSVSLMARVWVWPITKLFVNVAYSVE